MNITWTPSVSDDVVSQVIVARIKPAGAIEFGTPVIKNVSSAVSQISFESLGIEPIEGDTLEISIIAIDGVGNESDPLVMEAVKPLERPDAPTNGQINF